MATNVVRQSVAALLFGALAVGLAPDPVVTVSAWAEESRQLSPEETSRPGKWRNDQVPYLVEPQDCMSLSDPCREVAFLGSAQVAKTQAGINTFGTIACRTPAPMLTVLPSEGEVNKYVNLKLNPAIEATPELKEKVSEQKSRDEKGSTTRLKRFPGGWNQIVGANSSKGLQMVSVRALLLEEVSEYPFDVDGRGDPVDLAIARTKAFTENRKVIYVSTPGVKGSCRITAKYEAGDQRRFYVPCPHCDTFQVLKFDNLKWSSDRKPHGAYFVCAAAGCIIEPHHKSAMLARGKWLKCYPHPITDDEGKVIGQEEPGDFVDIAAIAFDENGRHARPSRGREPSFRIWQAYSPFVPWDDTVAEYLAAQGDPLKEKVFTQQGLGEAWEAKGDSPDYMKLLARREPELTPGVVPVDCLFLTGAADVQASPARIEWAIWGWGIGKTRWLVDKGVIFGDTTDLATYRALDDLLERKYRNALGRDFKIEAFAIDTGYATQTVYAWVRRHMPKGYVIGVDGRPGWNKPALGTFAKMDVTYKGEKLKGGVVVHPVGTFQLKAALYANLAKTIAGPIDGVYPAGYVHLPYDGVDEAWLKQLTAEFMVTKVRPDGLEIREWHKPSGMANEALDIAVYAHAAAIHWGLDRATPEDWARLAAERGAPPEKAQLDLALWQGLVKAADKPTDAQVAEALKAAGQAPAIETNAVRQPVERVVVERQTRLRGS